MSDGTNEILTRIERTLVALLRATTSQRLAEIREDKTLRLIHSLTGTAGISEIAKKAKVSTGKVSGIWQSWEEAGLIAKEGKSFKKLV